MRAPTIIAQGVLILTTMACAARSADAKLNVLFLFADDMRADSVRALGDPAVITPNLDALVQRGFVMQNAYCFGGNSPAVCLPSRNMLLSGNAYFRWQNDGPDGRRGQFAPADGPNFATAMKRAGYVTYHHGKRGNTAQLIQATFDTNKYLKNDEAERRSGEPGRELVDDAIQFLQHRTLAADGKPFFMYLAFGNPHDPRVAAEAYRSQYDLAKIPLPKNALPHHPFDNGELTIRDERLLPWPRTDADVRATWHDYDATITGMDHHIGRLLAALKQQQLLESTLIIFSADQGIAIGSHGLLGKQNLYDHSMKAPLVFTGPGIKPGKSDALVYLFDIFPTVCDLVDAEAPSGIDGQSFANVIRGTETVARPELMLAYRKSQRAIRDDRWKLIRYPEVDVTQLFDLETDPDEVHNLADQPEQRERITKMLARLADRQRHYGDGLPLTVTNPKPSKWTPPVN
ncbi:MAG TPA: sulfatase-like hydrolase/transferase [Planctomycetaceae bacterium]|jgi:arylsulfatase A-like enzyme|nr:sulfatase-like hydrolase/transferase [Planctomycetaceae bacterium]